jgi:hypothetical protein
VTTIDLWQYSIVQRSEYDDLTIEIPCIECGTSCGGSTLKVPLHWAVVKYENNGDSDAKFICEECTKKAGAEFIWQVAKAVDDVDHLFYGTENSEQMERTANLVDYVIGEITESWRRMARMDF